MASDFIATIINSNFNESSYIDNYSHLWYYAKKEIVALKILSNFSFEEIGKFLNEPVETVKWRYYKAIYSLKAILGNLAMFIVSFIIGVKVLISGKQKGNINQYIGYGFLGISVIFLLITLYFLLKKLKKFSK